METLKQKIDVMKQQDQLYIKFDFSGLDLSECEKLCDDMDCYMFILYEGEMVKRCKNCKKYDNADTINEYEETADILGYNPPTNPMLHYSDSYWYCRFCDEHNYFNNDWDCFRDYFDNEKIKYVNFKQTDTIYIYNFDALEVKYERFTLNNEICRQSPLNHIKINQKLVAYVCIEVAEDPNDPVDMGDGFIYEHKPNYYPYSKY
jgi:hypothetical protein